MRHSTLVTITETYIKRIIPTDITVTDWGYIFVTGTSGVEIDQQISDYCTVPNNGEFPFCDFNGNAYMETDINGNTGEPLDSVKFRRTYIACFDQEGVLSWSTRYGNGRNNIANAIHAHHNDKLYICGFANNPTTTDNYSYTLKDLIPSDTIDYFQPNYGTGTYDVVVARFSIPALTIGIEENKLYDNGKVFPNPTTGTVFVTIPGMDIDASKQYSYNLLDITGRIIRNGILYPNSSMLEISDLSNGIYYIIIKTSGNEIFYKKIIKI